MTRLIDADALKEAMHEYEDYKGYLVCDPEEIIDLAPTVEPKQGEWINEPKSLWDIAICSLCNETCIGYKSAKFCPNCGARMKEGDEK